MSRVCLQGQMPGRGDLADASRLQRSAILQHAPLGTVHIDRREAEELAVAALSEAASPEEEAEICSGSRTAQSATAVVVPTSRTQPRICLPQIAPRANGERLGMR
jgi:hypothetical protein